MDPEVFYLSQSAPNELSILPPDIPMMYDELHDPLERWAIFRMLPQLLKYDRAMISFFTNMKKGTLILPDYHE